MTFPNAKIEIYNTDDEKTHTITDALSIETIHNLSGQPGTFNFSLPAKRSTSTYLYNDIGNNYKAKIYLGYGTLDADDLQMVGRIQKFTGPLASGKEWVRVFEGMDQAEVLLRRLKMNKRWQTTGAADIVADLISGLTADTGITYVNEDIDIQETLTVRTETYLDILKKVSDYWSIAGAVKADFYVNNDNEFYWHSRPFRTEGVETLAVGTNILNYVLTYDIVSVKNRIIVYGAASAYYPNDKDLFTDALSGTLNGIAWDWTATSGTLSLGTVAVPKAGTYYIKCQKSTGDHICDLTLTLPKVINLRDINKLSFWYISSGITPKIRLLAPDNSNYFEADLPSAGAWKWFSQMLGDSNVYDADENPTGFWHKTSSADWWNITAVRTFNATDPSFMQEIVIDKLFFDPDRWMYIVDDEDSQDAFGIRMAEFTDENLLSNDECEIRAKTLRYQLKDRALRLDVGLVGNTNVKIGDRIPITLPSDNISDLDFDVLQVKHNYRRGSGNQPILQTTASMIYGGEIRKLPPQTPLESAVRQISNLKEVTSELYSRVVR